MGNITYGIMAIGNGSRKVLSTKSRECAREEADRHIKGEQQQQTWQRPTDPGLNLSPAT